MPRLAKYFLREDICQIAKTTKTIPWTIAHHLVILFACSILSLKTFSRRISYSWYFSTSLTLLFKTVAWSVNFLSVSSFSVVVFKSTFDNLTASVNFTSAIILFCSFAPIFTLFVKQILYLPPISYANSIPDSAGKFITPI